MAYGTPANLEAQASNSDGGRPQTEVSRRTILTAASVAAVPGAPALARTRSGSAARPGVSTIPKQPWKIAFEEHFLTRAYAEKYAPSISNVPGNLKGVFEDLFEIGETRIRRMDEAGIQYTILSFGSPGLQSITDAQEGRSLARTVNETLHAAIAPHSKRLGGFAALPTQNAAASADELEHCVKTYGFHGALINGFTNNLKPSGATYLDDPAYDALWERAQDLGVPIYLHPRNFNPNQGAIFDGRPELLAATWGYLVECSTHALRMVVGGVFDRYPKLTVCLGHLGEALPFAQWRISETYKQKMPKSPLKRSPGDYIKSNFVYTTSGFFDTLAMRSVVDTVGLDRVCFSTDYPWMTMADASAWFDNAPISDFEKLAIGRDNTIRLFNLQKLATETA